MTEHRTPDDRDFSFTEEDAFGHMASGERSAEAQTPSFYPRTTDAEDAEDAEGHHAIRRQVDESPEPPSVKTRQQDDAPDHYQF